MANQAIMMRINLVLSTLRSRRMSLSTLQAVVSLNLARGENLNLKDLAERLGVTTAAVTSVADSIEKLGFARRTSSSGDRRHISLKLTPKGIAFAEWLAEMLAGTDPGKPAMPPADESASRLDPPP